MHPDTYCPPAERGIGLGTMLELLSDRDNWLPGQTITDHLRNGYRSGTCRLAIDRAGRACEPKSPFAARWTLVGALNCCYAGTRMHARAYDRLVDALGRVWPEAKAVNKRWPLPLCDFEAKASYEDCLRLVKAAGV